MDYENEKQNVNTETPETAATLDEIIMNHEQGNIPVQPDNGSHKEKKAAKKQKKEKAPKQPKLPRKERRKIWKEEKARIKAAKKAKRQAKKDKKKARKEQYRYAPAPVRFVKFHLRKVIIIVIIVIVALIIGFFGFLNSQAFQDLAVKYRESCAKQEVSEDELYAAAPRDEEGEQKIAAEPGGGEDSSWTICVYMIGSNLEDMNENDLSDVTQLLVADAQETNAEESQQMYRTLYSDFRQELMANNMDLPEYLYSVQKPTATDAYYTDSYTTNTVATQEGYASTDIEEMTSGEWADNVTIVIQTGGATRWSNALVNPNKTQRFVYKNGKFKEVSNMALQDSCAPETLTGFINFCNENYASDHNMLVLWDHGGGAFGYGNDDIYGSGMSLQDLHDALAGAGEASETDPLFDVIGFDACLMSSAEVAHSLYGYADYLAASEESEPGDGWSYADWLGALSDDPSMSPAVLCQNIADSYVDHYIRCNINGGWLFGESAVTFSVLKLNEAEALYQSFCNLNKSILLNAVQDSTALAQIGQAGTDAIHYAEADYNVFNMLDMGSYVNNLTQYYPDECKAVQDALDKAVLYHRQNSYLGDSQGISVYFPADIDEAYGLAYFLQYINGICQDPSTQALYYYKIGGCLNEELQNYVTSIGGSEAKVLDTTALEGFDDLTPEIGDGSYSVTMSDEMASMVQYSEMEMAAYDADENIVTYYGDVRCVDQEGNTLTTDFDGQWVTLGGEPLDVEIISSSDTAIRYRSKVLYNGEESYLLFNYDVENDTFTVVGVKPLSDLDLDTTADVIGKSASTLTPGDTIVPIYDTFDFTTREGDTVEGNEVSYTINTIISMQNLPGGSYLSTIVVSDPRGDDYYSTSVQMDVSMGSISNAEISDILLNHN